MERERQILLALPNAEESARLRADLSARHGDWKIISALTSDEALGHTASVEFDVVLAGQDLSPKTGAEFLEALWESHPHTVRFLSVENPGQELLIQCIWHSTRWIAPPLTSDAVDEAVTRALELERWLVRKSLKQLVSKLRTFPTLPSLYQKILQLLNSPQATVSSVSELVSGDLAISTKILQVVNSAFYGLQQQVTEIDHAIHLLGLETVKSLVLAIQSISQMDGIKPVYFSVDRTWRHSLNVATLARKIADIETGDRALADAAYMGGLLHDLGKLVFAANLGEQYAGAISLASKNNLPLTEVENEVFGATHAEVAAYLVALWGLPENIVEAIALHHTPSQSRRDVFTPLTAVHAANVLSHERQAAQGDANHSKFDTEYLRKLNLLESVETWRAVANHAGKPPPTKRRQKASAPSISAEGSSSAPPPPAPAFPATEAAGGSWLRPVPLILAAAAAIILIGFVLPSLLIPTTDPTPRPTRPPVDRTEAATEKPTSPPASSSTEPTPAPSAASGTAASAPAPAQSATPAGKPAPATPAAPNPADRLSLKAIFYRPTRPAAVINERTLFVGDEIDGAIVISIERDAVHVLMNGKQGTLKLRNRNL